MFQFDKFCINLNWNYRCPDPKLAKNTEMWKNSLDNDVFLCKLIHIKLNYIEYKKYQPLHELYTITFHSSFLSQVCVFHSSKHYVKHAKLE